MVRLISAPPKLGRAAISRGSLAKVDQLPPKLAKNPLQFDAPQLPAVPNIFPVGVVTKLTGSMVGEVFYRMSGNYQDKIRQPDAVLSHAGSDRPDGIMPMAQRVSPSTSSWCRQMRMEEFKGIIRWIQTQGHYSS